jgi:hypothetical protein
MAKFIKRDTKTGEFSIEKYPRYDLGIVRGLDRNIKYHGIVDNRPAIDNRLHKLIDVGYTFNDDPFEGSKNIGTAIRVYEKQQLPNETIIGFLDNSLGNHLDNLYPAWERNKHMAQASKLVILKGQANWDESDSARYQWINSLADWCSRCRTERDKREKNLLEKNILPSFEWERRPDKPVILT